MESIIGKLYAPSDNSYCINVETKKKALIVQKKPYIVGACILILDDDEYYNPYPIEEDGAKFTIVSEPYIDMVDFPENKEYTFINVQSSNTNSIYRVLFDNTCVIQNKVVTLH